MKGCLTETTTCVVAKPLVYIIRVCEEHACIQRNKQKLALIHYSFLLRISFENVNISAKYILDRTKFRPTVGIICGSGLGKSKYIL